MTTRFTHLQLENWRNFRKVDAPLGVRCFVVGPYVLRASVWAAISYT